MDHSGFLDAIRVKSMRGRKPGDMWRTKSPIIAQVWIDSKQVHFLNTIHAPEHDALDPTADRTVKRGKRGERGHIAASPGIRDYNRHKGSVDFTDRILSNITTELDAFASTLAESSSICQSCHTLVNCLVEIYGDGLRLG